MSALPPKADIGTGPRITFGAPAPAAWRYLLRCAALHRGASAGINTAVLSQKFLERLTVGF